MGILTPDQDFLKYDPLKKRSMKDSDPLGKAASQRVPQYDKELGFAMHPEEKEQVLAYRDGLKRSANTQQFNLDAYKTEFATALGGADDQAQGLLGQYDNVPGQETIDIKFLGGPEGEEEKTYRVNKDWAVDWFPSNYLKANFTYDEENDRYTVDGYTPGDSESSEGGATEPVKDKRLASVLADIQRQTTGIDDDLSTNINNARDLASQEIGSQRGIATASYDQQVSQAETTIKNTREKWTNYLSEQRQAFTKGVANNTGGIRDLVESGALILRGKTT